MCRLRPCLLLAALAVPIAWSQTAPADFVLVEGGTVLHAKSVFRTKAVAVPSFYLGRCEVTQREWTEVMGTNPAEFKGDDRPVEMVTWYDCIDYCNRRSLKEGLAPYYTIDKTTADPDNQNPEDELKWTVKVNPGANGYRLPTEAEWEYAAGGGQKSRNFTYSGGETLESVGWFWKNSGEAAPDGLWNWPTIEQNKNRTQPVGRKAPNELGLHDLSGNVREWCWDWYGEPDTIGAAPAGVPAGALRLWKGGGWMGGDFCCEPSFRAGYEPHSKGYDQGFRVCRNP
ncbi:MAG: SUMF1/EgtB/PvdO family nonheme iron enzyme [Opitutaceae bacterium]|nr:SUMF1/EgtB/PvdO family nonheme iron enzyme [Opitutaceae bacterium]